MTRKELVREARSYIGTTWLHQGRSRSGVDCLGLLVCVGRAFDFTPFDATDYDRFPDGDWLRRVCGTYLIPIDKSAMQIGDVALMHFGGDPMHVGILGDYLYGGLSLIHAYVLRKKVIETRLDSVWRGRVVAAFSVPGVTP